MIGDHPDRYRAVRPGLRIDDLQALHAEQHRRRILDHDARGFLMILMSVARPKIAGTAGSRITTPRGNRPSAAPGCVRLVDDAALSRCTGGQVKLAIRPRRW
jgi:hypothetical protein